MATGDSLAPHRRPVAPRLVDRDVVRSPQPVEVPVVIAPKDNPLRGWRVIPAIPLADRAWRHGIERNAVACYLTSRRRGGAAETFMASLPFFTLIASFGWAMMAVPHPREAIWLLTLMLASVLPVLAMVMGTLMMGWGVRRYFVGMALEHLLTTRLKPEEILRGLAIRPIWRMSLVVMISSLCVPLLMAFAAARSGYPLTGEWFLLGFIGLLVAFSVSMLLGQLGAAMALRAHVYIRREYMATVRAFIDVFGMVTKVLLLLLVLVWIGALVSFVFSILTGNSPGRIVGLNPPVNVGLLDSLLVIFLICAISVVLVVAICFLGYQMIAGMVRAMENALEFTYLYPEEWWVTNPGRGAEEDTYRAGVPWIAPHSELMETFRSRAS